VLRVGRLLQLLLGVVECVGPEMGGGVCGVR
jgi:hypothetical protein